MVRLKNRQLQIPNGFVFNVPELGFKVPPYCSFDTVVNAVLKVVLANPKMAGAKHWPTTRAGVGDWVDENNAVICERNGWNDYIVKTGDPSPPKPLAPGFLEKLRNVAGAVRKITSGAETLLDWEQSGQSPVANSEAELRAAICVVCASNQEGNLLDWFTVPASEKIRKQLSRLHEMNLSTSVDDKLHVCEKCLCPLKLKVHTPLPLILNHIKDETKNELPKFCWILDKKE